VALQTFSATSDVTKAAFASPLKQRSCTDKPVLDSLQPFKQHSAVTSVTSPPSPFGTTEEQNHSPLAAASGPPCQPPSGR